MTPAPDAGLDSISRAPHSGSAPSRKTGTAMAAEAATFALASATHFTVGFTDAAIPELLIAAVLADASTTAQPRKVPSMTPPAVPNRAVSTDSQRIRERAWDLVCPTARSRPSSRVRSLMARDSVLVMPMRAMMIASTSIT